MSRTIANLTAESERDTKAVVEKLESLSSYSGEDIRFTAKHHQDTLRKIAALGLDPNDTTAEELFHTLQSKLASDSRQFAKALNYQAHEPQTNAKKLIELTAVAEKNIDGYAIKKAVAKALLRKDPPTHLLKKLKYRSVESMLKREDVCQLFALLPLTESSSWHKKFAERLAKLKSTDFETRPISYNAMALSKLRVFSEVTQPVSYTPLMASITVWPVAALAKQESVVYGLQLLQAAEVIEVDSLYLKNCQFQPQFGRLASNLYETGKQHQLQISGQEFFEWHHLKCLFNSRRNPLEIFASLHPAMSWWKDAGKTILLGEELVSMHMADIVNDLLGNGNFADRIVSSGASAVKGSVFERYLSHSNVSNYFRGQMYDSDLALEPVLAEDSIVGDMEQGLI